MASTSTVESFVTARERDWARLEALLDRSRGDLRRLDAAELEELGALYRRVASDLAIARRDFPGDRVLLYLNQLVARGHAQVYRGPAGVWKRVARFFLADCPQVYRANLRFILAALALFLVPGLAAFIAVQVSDALAATLVPQELAAMIREGQMWTDIELGVAPAESSFIMTNNIQVAFLAFGGGVLLGLGTLYVLAMNGLLLGAVAGYCQRYGLSLPLWSFVAPHGGIELSVIVFAGGAGLMLGWAIIHPGLLTRSEALSVAAMRAATILVGCVPLLVVAGLIEGFVSPSMLPAGVKLVIGLLGFVLLHAFLLSAGRSPRPGADAQRQGAAVARQRAA